MEYSLGYYLDCNSQMQPARENKRKLQLKIAVALPLKSTLILSLLDITSENKNEKRLFYGKKLFNSTVLSSREQLCGQESTVP